MPVKDKTAEEREARCEYCFTPRRGRKMLKRHTYLNNIEFGGVVCDVRCGELWQKQFREDYEKVASMFPERRDGGMVDTLVSNTSGASRVGSNPSPGTEIDDTELLEEVAV